MDVAEAPGYTPSNPQLEGVSLLAYTFALARFYGRPLKSTL